jgi:predicted transcriptional regulator of viral defense system
MFMKSKKNLLEQLKNMPNFDRDTVYQLGSKMGLKKTTLSVYISRFLKSREIIKLKRDMYISADFFDKNKGDVPYRFYLANILRAPSYVSMWSALDYYGLVTEAVYGISSVTPKVTRKFETKIGNFSYQSINKDVFSDYVLVKGKPASSADGFNFFIASPSKALFDLLYFKTNRFRSVDFRDIDALIESLRIDLLEMDETERNNFNSMIKKYYE